MHDPFPARYRLLAVTTYSTYSRKLEHPDQDCKLYLIPASDPAFIPSDWEAWPVYQQSIVRALKPFPEAFRAAVVALEQKRQDLKGLQNRDVPLGVEPNWASVYRK
jgi:hypothetical protein